MGRFHGVRRIKQDKYEINFRTGSRRVYKRVSAGSMREAFLLRSELMRQYGTSADIKSCREKLSFADILNELIIDMKADNLRAKTISRVCNTYETFFVKFLPLRYPEVAQMKQINARVINDYKKFVVYDMGRSRGWRAEITIVKLIFSRLIRGGYCPASVKDDLAEFKRPAQQQKDYVYISKQEKQQLLVYVKEDKPAYFGVLYFLVRLGWRIEETLSIKKENLRWKGTRPVVIKLKSEDRKNKRNFELATIDDDLAEVIIYYARISETEWLFPNSKGSKIKSDKFRIYLAKVSINVIGKRLTPHDFRHSLVTEMGLANMPIRDVMAITGHTDINVVLKYYSHSTPEGRENVLKKTKI